MLNTLHTNTDSAHIRHTFSTSINNIGTLNNADYADTFNTHTHSTDNIHAQNSINMPNTPQAQYCQPIAVLLK